jgi:hypothetical protein
VTSAINYTIINENFPVPGQDNDTQTFRDNFNSIKNNFREAKDEITNLQTNTAKTNTTNDFKWNTVSKVKFQNNIDTVFDFGGPMSAAALPQEVNFENGPYQVLRLATNFVLTFKGFPGDPTNIETTKTGVGKVTMEIYSDSTTARTITFSTSGGAIIKKSSNFPVTLTADSTTNPTIIEIWRRSNNFIFINYLGKFS